MKKIKNTLVIGENDNYNQNNIDNVRKMMEEKNLSDKSGKVWAMVEQSTDPCYVTITSESRKIAVKSLFR